jgi:hypothetical protein
MNQHAQQEAKRDISSVNFIVTLTGLEIDTILTAVGVTTSMWAKNRRQMPGSFDLASLSSGCDKLMNPVEEDYQQRCASDFQNQREQKLGEISRICKLCNYEPDCKEHDAAIRKDERDKFLKRMLECISQYEMLPNGMDFVIEDLLAELRQAGEP